jgi:hypothetical protein
MVALRFTAVHLLLPATTWRPTGLVRMTTTWTRVGGVSVRGRVYVDAFNLYYGARTLCGRGTPGWRWLDIRTLVSDLVAAQVSWVGSAVTRVVYGTARIDAVINLRGTPTKTCT